MREAEQGSTGAAGADHDAVTELTGLVAGTGGMSTDRRRWPAWFGDKPLYKTGNTARRLSLHRLVRGNVWDPARPLEYAFYQPPRLLMVRRRLETSEKGCDADQLAEELDRLVRDGEADGFKEAIIDGVVPVALAKLLKCVGVVSTEVAATAAAMVASACEELHWQELSRREAASRPARPWHRRDRPERYGRQTRASEVHGVRRQST